MADEGRRQVVQDPLAQKAAGQTPDRSFALGGIRSPGQGAGDAVFQEAMSGFAALGSVQKALAGVVATKKDEAVAQGKLNYMTGMTEAEMLRSGDKYTKQGYETLSSIDQASQWYQNELLNIDETTREMDPKDYNKYLMDKRAQALENLPADPAVRKLYAAAFENFGPQLAAKQFEAHNELNKTKNINALSDALYSSAGVNEDASRVMPGGTLRVSPGVVSPAIQYSDEDRDVGIRTILGEAGGEGEVGMAAVAQVLKNRAIDGGYGGNSIKAVSLAPKQFSAWNEGPGGIPAIRNWSKDSKAYLRAAKVYDAVMAGHVADMTNGATHYFSPKGMELLKRQGSQSHLVPSWWAGQASKNEVTIGNHRFAGKARGLDQFIGREPLAEPSSSPEANTDYFGEQIKIEGRNYAPTNHQMEREYNPNDIMVQPDAAPGAVAAEAGVALKHTTGTSQLRQTLDAANLRPEDKAAAATDAVIRALEEGNDQVLNDIGGEGYLRSLGATPQMLNAVQTAKSQMTKKSQDTFNVDQERVIEDFKSSVKNGEFKDVNEVLTGVKHLQEQFKQDEQWAHSLANETLTEYHKQTEDDKALNPQLASDLAGIKRLMDEEPEYTAEEAAKAAEMLGQVYDIDGKTVQGWITDMWQRDASRQAKMRTELETAQKKREKEDKVKAQVESALKSTAGLKSIKGTVTIVDENGHEREVTAQEYGIRELKSKELQNAQLAVDKGVKPEQAEATLNKTIYEKLAKQGVVDTEFGQQIEGALKGSILDGTGKVSEDATKAFDFWLQMDNNPNVGPAYMAEMVTDPDVRVLLNTAKTMYAGRMNIEEALHKASLRISQKDFKPDARIAMNDKFSQQVGAGVEKSLDELMKPNVWTGKIFTDNDRKQVNNKRDFYRQDIIDRANAYHIQNPQVDPAAHIKMAIEDFSKDAVAVNGNILLGKSVSNQRLDQVMGLELQGQQEPQKALDAYMTTFGEDFFPNMLEGRTQSWLDKTARDNIFTGFGLFTKGYVDVTLQKPMYNIEYNSTSGMLEAQLWKDESRTELIGKPIHIRAKDVGDWWKESLKKQSPIGAGVSRAVTEGVVDTTNKIRDNNNFNDLMGLTAPK